jgi:hypothetical protein
MKTAPDLRQEPSISVGTSNCESGRTTTRWELCHFTKPKVQLRSVIATKDRQEAARRIRERPTGRKRVAHSRLPLMGTNEYPPAMILRGKWVLHAQMGCVARNENLRT